MWGDIVGEAIRGMLVIGIAVGLGIAGLIWLAVWLWSHLSIAWI